MNTADCYLNELTSHECLQITGGIITAISGIVELAHGVLIAREATNWVGKLWVEGCQGVDESDYFTRFLCLPFDSSAIA